VGQCSDAEEDEAMALLKGVRLAEHWLRATPVEFESDCAELFRKVLSADSDSSMISALILDIKEIVAARKSCKVWMIWREQNGIAHNLAQFALKSRIQDLVLSDQYHEPDWYYLIKRFFHCRKRNDLH
jgi:hypothetical protein